MNVSEEFLRVKNSSHPISELLEDPKWKRAYNAHFRNAKRRGIGFHLSLEEFTMIWLASGRILERGKHAGQYQLCRFGDQGDYIVGNVFVARMEANVHAAHYGKKKKPAHRRKLRANLARTRKYVSVSANNVLYSSLTECGKAHGITAEGVKTRIKSNSESFKNWRVEKVYHGMPKANYTDNVITFPSLNKEIDISDLVDLADDFDFEAFVNGVSK